MKESEKGGVFALFFISSFIKRGGAVYSIPHVHQPWGSLLLLHGFFVESLTFI
jgi:hypothetical protein